MFSALKLKERYRIVKSREPEDDKTHIVVYESETLRGCNCQRVFKGSYQKCRKIKDALEKRMLQCKRKRKKFQI
jgi:hypothetical protein